MIVVIKIAARGDLLLAAPAFRYLRESRRGERIVLVVGESCRDVAEHLPYFDEIRTIDDRALFTGSPIAKLRVVGELLRILRSARGGGHSEAIVLHRDWRYGVVAWLAGVKTRRGFSSGRGDRFLTHPYRAGEREHHEAQYLGVMGGSGAVLPGPATLWRFAPGERERALQKAASLGLEVDGRPLLALGFGGGRNVKMAVDLKLWPLERYVELAGRLEEEGMRAVWLGDGHDAERLGEVDPGVNLAGRLSVVETAAVVSASRLVIANDTMLLHLGRVLGIPALGIFGPTDPAHTGPHLPGSAYLWLGPDRVPCSPCHQDGYYPPCRFEHRCMRELPVEAVLRTALRLLRAEPSAAGLDRSVGVG